MVILHGSCEIDCFGVGQMLVTNWRASTGRTAGGSAQAATDLQKAHRHAGITAVYR